jgi:hypothetical protein
MKGDQGQKYDDFKNDMIDHYKSSKNFQILVNKLQKNTTT